MTASRARLRQVASSAPWFLLTLPLAVVLASVALSPASNWIAQAALAGFCILAISRPDAALLVTAALVGFGIILSHLAGVPPLRVTELLVVASLAGCCIRATAQPAAFGHALTGWISVPIVLLATAVIASTLVWQWLYQIQTGYASMYFTELLRSVSRDYFFQRGDFSLLVSTAVILEGLALYVVVAALCRMDATFFARALRMLAIGGAGLGVMSAVRLAEILLRNPDVIRVLRATAGGLRISPQIPDYIAAGSYFALCWLVSLGLAFASARRRLVWVAVGVPLIGALYLTGSRSVIAAALAGLLVLIAIVVRRRAVAVRSVAAFAVAAVVLMVLSYPWMTGRDVLGETAKISLRTRVELARTSLRVIATRPVFGIGLERYHLEAGRLATPELNALWPSRKNPHNDFLRVGAELGLLGLALFLWILAAAGVRIWKALKGTPDARLAGLVGGIVAFLITSLVSDPLMVREVSYVFWIALGLAVAQSAAAEAVDDVPAPSTSAWSRRVSALKWPIALLLASVLLLSVPLRARRELDGVDLTHVSYGLFDWSIDADGTVNRWSGPRVRIFVDRRARRVEIPLSGTLPSGALQDVEVWVDDRLANRITVGREWQRLRTVFPADDSPGPHRIDLVVSPTWVPADVIPGSRDRRVIGVKVGTVDITR